MSRQAEWLPLEALLADPGRASVRCDLVCAVSQVESASVLYCIKTIRTNAILQSLLLLGRRCGCCPKCPGCVDLPLLLQTIRLLRHSPLQVDYDRLHSCCRNDLMCSFCILQVQLALSPSQVQDILALRRLFFDGLVRHQHERNRVIQKLSKDYQHTDSARTWAERLQQTIDEEQQMYYQVIAAIQLGVSLTARPCYILHPVSIHKSTHCALLRGDALASQHCCAQCRHPGALCSTPSSSTFSVQCM